MVAMARFLSLLVVGHAAHTRALTCTPSPQGLELTWNSVASADEYEVQIGTPGEDVAIGGESTDVALVNLKYLLPGQVYWFQVRSHSQHLPDDNGWTAFSAKEECMVPHKIAANSSEGGSTALQDLTSDPHSSSPRRRRYFTVEMIRESRTSKPDGLDNHNAGNAEAVSQYLAWRTRSGCVMMLFKVHINHADLKAVTPGDGYKSYANYLSCDVMGGSEYKCRPIWDDDCNWLRLSQSECWSAQTHTSSSLQHVGMGKIEVVYLAKASSSILCPRPVRATIGDEISLIAPQSVTKACQPQTFIRPSVPSHSRLGALRFLLFLETTLLDRLLCDHMVINGCPVALCRSLEPRHLIRAFDSNGLMIFM